MDTPLSSRTDPALAANRRILSISLWKNTATGEDIVHIQYGAKLDLGSVVGPEGSAIKIRAIEQGYVLEASIPWTALAVPDGRNPFKPGEAMTAVMEVIWGGGDQGRTSMHFHKDPGRSRSKPKSSSPDRGSAASAPWNAAISTRRPRRRRR